MTPIFSRVKRNLDDLRANHISPKKIARRDITRRGRSEEGEVAYAKENHNDNGIMCSHFWAKGASGNHNQLILK
jgi:hypothetical protein